MTTETHLVIRPADETDSHTISMLAHAIWPGTYGEILNGPQLQYMLGLFYSEQALRKQMDNGHHFFLAEISSEPVGFISYTPGHTEGAFRIHKLYVHPMIQGRGIGKELIATVTMQAKKKNASLLRLNVNRHNPARIFYEKTGFAIIREEDIAIGQGYFMNDYVMEKKI